ncbi:hypothetical protein MRB53_040508 [Persea americana]|nr:hypothetical protein MRB53_040508 [Persea americana]
MRSFSRLDSVTESLRRSHQHARPTPSQHRIHPSVGCNFERRLPRPPLHLRHLIRCRLDWQRAAVTPRHHLPPLGSCPKLFDHYPQPPRHHLHTIHPRRSDPSPHCR